MTNLLKKGIGKQPVVMAVIDELNPEELNTIGSLLKEVGANVTLLKRVPLSENGPIGTTQARLDLSEANNNLGVAAAQQIAHGFNQSVLARLVNGPIDAMIVGKANDAPMLLVKNPEAPGMEILMASMPNRILSQNKSPAISKPKPKPYQSLFAKVNPLTQQNKDSELRSEFRFKI